MTQWQASLTPSFVGPMMSDQWSVNASGGTLFGSKNNFEPGGHTKVEWTDDTPAVATITTDLDYSGTNFIELRLKTISGGYNAVSITNITPPPPPPAKVCVQGEEAALLAAGYTNLVGPFTTQGQCEASCP
jgi:hypothetical protein